MMLRVQTLALFRECIQRERAGAVPPSSLSPKARGELVPKAVVQQQAGFLMVALRQRIQDVEQARRILSQAARQLLEELQDLPGKVTDPNWRFSALGAFHGTCSQEVHRGIEPHLGRVPNDVELILGLHSALVILSYSRTKKNGSSVDS
jgi:hypothetical protein